MSRFPLLTPELLLGSAPPPQPGPVRFALPNWSEREQPTLVRECFARLGYRYDIERVPDVPFRVDISLNMLPGLMMATGRLHGSRNRRTRAHVEDGTDDAVLIVNLRGPHLVEQRNTELVLGDGDAVLVSAADPSCFTHRPPGDMLAMRFAKGQLAPLLRDAGASYMRRIPSGTQALKFLTNYIAIAWDGPTAANRRCSI